MGAYLTYELEDGTFYFFIRVPDGNVIELHHPHTK